MEGSFKEIPEEHPIYREFKRKKVSVILKRISQRKACQGLRTKLKRSMG